MKQSMSNIDKTHNTCKKNGSKPQGSASVKLFVKQV